MFTDLQFSNTNINRNMLNSRVSGIHVQVLSLHIGVKLGRTRYFEEELTVKSTTKYFLVLQKHDNLFYRTILIRQ